MLHPGVGFAEKKSQKSGPRISPPAGVQAANQLTLLTLAPTKRTLPSPIPTLIPPECGDTGWHMQVLVLGCEFQLHFARVLSHLVGEGWNSGRKAWPYVKGVRVPQSALEAVGVWKVL